MKKALLITSMILLVGCAPNEVDRRNGTERLGNRYRTEQRDRRLDRRFNNRGVRYNNDVRYNNVTDANEYYRTNFTNVKGDIEEFLARSNLGFRMDLQDEAYRRYVLNDLERAMIGNDTGAYLNYDEFRAYRAFVERYDNFFNNGRIGTRTDLRRISPRV